MEKLSNTEAELKKLVAYKKKRVFPRLLRFLFSLFPDITTLLKHGTESAFAENTCNSIFLTKRVHNLFFTIFKSQTNLRSPKL